MRTRAALSGVLATIALMAAATADLRAQPAAAAGEAPSPRTVAISLSEAVALMLRDNRSVRSVLLSRAVDDFNLRVAEDQFNPQFALAGSAGYSRPQRAPGDPRPATTLSAGWTPSVSLALPYGTRIVATAPGGFSRDRDGNRFDQGIDIGILQPLLRGAGSDVATASLEIARINRRVQALATESAIVGNIVLAIQAYRRLMQAGEQVRIAEDSLRRAVDLMAVNRQLVAAGRLAEVEIVQSEANVARQELALLSARNGLDAARLDLVQILALDTAVGLTPTEGVRIERRTFDLRQSLETARTNRPDYRQSHLQVEIARLNLRLAEDGLRWEVNAVAAASVDSGERTFGATLRRAVRTEPAFTLGLELRIPLSNLSDQARAVSARIALQQQELALRDLEQRLEAQVRNGLRQVEIGWQSQRLAELAVRLSEQKLDVERQRLRAGRSSNFQVVAFEDDLVRARTDLLNARIGYLNALTALDDVLGVTLAAWGVRVEAM
ncbi:TolC family protein [Stella sp.]|uniref:TolC family protein n=1 Tax=Stella sp. TaxID=2912054 RepID=UPI0035B1F49E